MPRDGTKNAAGTSNDMSTIGWRTNRVEQETSTRTVKDWERTIVGARRCGTGPVELSHRLQTVKSRCIVDRRAVAGDGR
jgi:hypothetical protein